MMAVLLLLGAWDAGIMLAEKTGWGQQKREQKWGLSH